jgi:hypothetical protein
LKSILLGLSLVLSSANATGQDCRPDWAKMSDKVLVSMAQGGKLGDCYAYRSNGYDGKVWNIYLGGKIVSEYVDLTLSQAAIGLRELGSAGACEQ